MVQKDPVATPPEVQAPPVSPQVIIPKASEFLFPSRPPGSFAVVQFGTEAASNKKWHDLYVSRPTLLRFVSCSAGATENDAYFSYWPEVNPEELNKSISPALGNYFAITPTGRDIWLWAPGRWWISVDPLGIFGSYVCQFMAIPLEDPSLVQGFLDQRTAGDQTVVSADIATGAAATLITLANIMRCHTVMLQNTGAVDVRLSWGSTTPTATTGTRLAAGEKIVYGPANFPLPQARLRAFSAAASAVGISYITRQLV